MFQPRVKLEFIRRYLAPDNGWKVYVDIDASEEGRTGGTLTANQQRMREDASRVKEALARFGVQVGGPRGDWFEAGSFPRVAGDRDIVAFHTKRRRCVIAEIEGESTGQSEQKLYKAMGQLVMAMSVNTVEGWDTLFVLVVHGEKIAAHLERAKALQKLNISGLALARDAAADRWYFGRRLG